MTVEQLQKALDVACDILSKQPQKVSKGLFDEQIMAKSSNAWKEFLLDEKKKS